MLVMEEAQGRRFEDICAAPAEVRQGYAETLWQFVFEGILLHGCFNADPHPGNYLFADNGDVWFLDFGCVRRLLKKG